MHKKVNFKVIQWLLLVILLGIIISLTFIELTFITNLKNREMISNSLLRLMISSFFIVVLVKQGYHDILQFNKSKSLFFIIFPALLIAVNNFPISAFLRGRTALNGDGYQVLLFLTNSLIVGLFEEMLFRGIIVIFLVQVIKESKFKTLYLIIFSAIIFSLFHLVNLFDGAGVYDVLLQVGYSFLLGILWALIYLKTNNLWIVMILHGLYNFFGEVMFYLGSVNDRWDLLTVVLTVSLAVITIFHSIFILVNEKKYPNLITMG